MLPIKKISAHPLDGARGIMFSGCPSMRTCVLVGGIPDWLAMDFFIVFYSLWTSLRQSHTHTQPFNGLWSGTTQVGRYQKKRSPTHTHPDHRTSVIIFLHLQRSIASTLFTLRAWQSSRTASLQVLFGLPLVLGPWTS